MKILYVLPLCLASASALAAGIYEVDRSQWEAKPAVAATKPAPRASAAASSRTSTQTTTQAAEKSQPATAPTQTAPAENVAQTCQPGHPCNDLQ